MTASRWSSIGNSALRLILPCSITILPWRRFYANSIKSDEKEEFARKNSESNLKVTKPEDSNAGGNYRDSRCSATITVTSPSFGHGEFQRRVGVLERATDESDHWVKGTPALRIPFSCVSFEIFDEWNSTRKIGRKATITCWNLKKTRIED